MGISSSNYVKRPAFFSLELPTHHMKLIIIILSSINFLWARNVYEDFAEITAYRLIPTTPTLVFHKAPFMGYRPNCLVDTIIQDLKFLGHGRDFNVSAFELRKDKIYRRILQIKHSIGEEDLALAKKLLYAEEIFQALVDAKELLKFFSLKNTKDQRILRKIIGMNTTLLSFFDSNNEPNYRAEKYLEIVQGLILDLDTYIYKFDKIGFVPFATRLAFDQEVEKAKYTLLHLSSFVSGDESSDLVK